VDAEHLPAFEPRHLVALATVARTGSFRAAANELGYVQSAVSRQIATLEQTAGTRLLERASGSGVVQMTPAGALLVEHAEAVLARLDAAKLDVQRTADGESGVVRLGTPQGIAPRLLPAILSRLRRSAPDVRVEALELPTAEPLFELVDAGDLDLGIAHLPLDPGPYSSEHLLSVYWRLAVPSSWPVARRRQRLQLADLSELPLIAPRTERLGPPVTTHLRAAGYEPNVVAQTDVFATARALVSAGIGAALLPSFALEPDDAAITALDVADVPLIQRLGLFWHRERLMAPATETLRDVTLEVCASSQSRPSRAARPLAEPADARSARHGVRSGPARRGLLTTMRGARACDTDPGDGVAAAS
jgi:DNA-binding transcriptional LysR family regulator